jgi:predicted nucleic acid-binding protein
LGGSWSIVRSAVAVLSVASKCCGSRLVDNDLVVAHARNVLAGIHLVDLDALTIRLAIDVNPRALRALDAIHLATALSLEPDLEGMVVYDKRPAEAARAAGLTVWSPA